MMLRKFHTPSLTMLILISLQGCFTWRVNENFFFRPLAMDLVGDRVEISMDDGTILVGRFLKHPDARATLVYFGGNTEYVDISGKTIQKLSEYKLNILMVGYRGYGASAGNPSLDTFFSDNLSVFRYARNQPDTHGLPVLAYGFSLGGFAAAYVASQESCDGLVLEATGTTVKQWTELLLPWYYKPFVNVDIDDKLQAIDNLDNIRKIKRPLLVMGGKADNQAPATMSQNIFDASPSQTKSLHIFEIGEHGTIKDESDFKTVFSTFLKRIQ